MVSSISFGEQVIIDVPKSDPYYSSVENVVDKGYMSIFGNQFFGDRTITRKELAIVIDRLHTRLENTNQLSETEAKELSVLSQKFKTFLTENETKANASSDNLSSIANEQKVINHDLTKINAELKEELKELKQEQETQKLHTWIGIGAVGLIALIVN